MKETAIENAGLPAELQTLLLQNGFTTLEEVLAIPVSDLSEMEWFTPDMLDLLAERVKKLKK